MDSYRYPLYLSTTSCPPTIPYTAWIAGQRVGCLHDFWNWLATGFGAGPHKLSDHSLTPVNQSRTTLVCAIVLWYLHEYGPDSTYGCFTRVAELAASNLLCPSAQDTTFLTPPRACEYKTAATTNSYVIMTHSLCVFRQYNPAFPYTSLYTGSVHPGVKQILGIAKGCKGCQSLRPGGAWENRSCAGGTGR